MSFIQISGYHTEDAKKMEQRPPQQTSAQVALGDVFDDRLQTCKKQQLQKYRIQVAPEKCFVGFEAYKKLLAIPEINARLPATPPNFRPCIFSAPPSKPGKTHSLKNPSPVDAAGFSLDHIIRDKSRKKKGLTIGAGSQWTRPQRHA
ncbi:MAG: hypothetical protein U5K79_07760 [Cyclobacteriaceae bacterium]|nr:hypothetical protein [Cyclobacteriaceae bacterium]